MKLYGKRGFTLIEILIVVAIIGILASVVLVGLRGTTARGRDARRISDLHQAQTGLELYFGKCGHYPGNTETGTTCGVYQGNNTWGGMRTALIGSGLSISNVPSDDPLAPQRAYQYAADPINGGNYVLGATLEDPSNPAFGDDIDGTVFGINCADPVYCVQL